MNLRWRLTLYYTALSALILVLAGVSFFVVLKQSLQTTLDKSLRDAAELAASQLRDEVKGTFTESETDLILERLVGDSVLLVKDPKGTIVDGVGTPPIEAPLVEGFTVVADQRVYAQKLDSAHWIQVMRSQVETLHAMGQAQRLLLSGLPFLLLAGLGLGYFLADKALRPVDDVTSLAERIANSGQFQSRLPEAKGDDEMARLSRTFNRMLAKLETSLEREKAFALAAAHELRTPLSLIQGRSSLSLDKPRSAEYYQNALGQIYANSQQMSDMVESLLALAHTHQAPHLEELKLADLLSEVAETYQAEAAQRSMRLELELQVAVVKGDKTALTLVLQNLVQNAIKYGREGGTIWLKSALGSDEAFLEVSDDGEGIADAELERLKQPFQRGIGLQGVSGSGLGLALAVLVAEQHGGRLELCRAPQGGLSAIVHLPIH